MFRLSQLARHFSRPLPNYLHTSAATAAIRSSQIMTSSTIDERNSRMIHTAACLIIGDEVLGGKMYDSFPWRLPLSDEDTTANTTSQTNSAFMAKFCFGLGMTLKRIEVIADDESEIIEAVRRMSNNYDFVVTSGGIGPTHDDITYQSIATAFSLPLILHPTVLSKMKKLSKPHPSQVDFSWDVDSPARRAKYRMIELPTDTSIPDSKQVLFPCDDLWVPVACVNGNVHILPGVPRLFERLLEGMRPFLLPRLQDPEKGMKRILISTPMVESEVAGYLTELAGRGGGDQEFLESLVEEVVKNVKGKRIESEGEDDEDAPVSSQ
ncbi:hypothetical protein HYFRA_00004579 [Hymenoscyphus fraxineus]|uniref:MoaB/Mog domain-containing protein n=1 Tax=Hymenoscyphus fraxineus TaxID=746836 RepID=A0A9N9KY14_9HELO|nr:hypothetical protein HYFRA_00004579 [Hymenoscyphus fraxineus]